MDLDIALDALKIVKSVFDEHGLTFTLAAGTLLGAVREKKFMGWDYDTDLSCSDTDFHKVPGVIAALNKRGITCFYSEMFRVIAIYYKGTTIDVDFWRDRGEYRVMALRYVWNRFGQILYAIEWLLSHRPSGGMRLCRANGVKMATFRYAACAVTSALPFALRKWMTSAVMRWARATGNPRGIVQVRNSVFSSYSQVELYGIPFNAPGDIDGYMTNQYGEDWRIPQKGWVYYDADGVIYSPSQIPDGRWDIVPLRPSRP